MYQPLSESCGGGPCPTLWVDPETGDVKVQGYRTDPPAPMPPEEDAVRIPADAWARLLAGLPPRTLLAALLSHQRAAQMQGR